MESKEIEFNGYKVILKRLTLKDANYIFHLVASGMLKLNLGDFNFFKEYNTKDFELFQNYLCKYSYKIIENKKEDGTIEVKENNLSLMDIQEYLPGFMPLLGSFLEFNFGFFSLARKFREAIFPPLSEPKGI